MTCSFARRQSLMPCTGMPSCWFVKNNGELKYYDKECLTNLPYLILRTCEVSHITVRLFVVSKQFMVVWSDNSFRWWSYMFLHSTPISSGICTEEGQFLGLGFETFTTCTVKCGMNCYGINKLPLWCKRQIPHWLFHYLQVAIKMEHEQLIW